MHYCVARPLPLNSRHERVHSDNRDSQDSFPNAYTLAIANKEPFVMLNTGLLDLLSLDELQCVIAHELGHLKCDHGIWLTVANALAGSTIGLLPFVTNAAEEALFKWRRAAELTCDRCAATVTRH
jgi:Zn-dependent protease with chaperone function